MDKKLEAFIKLSKIFKENGHSLFVVGGAVRDYLLNLPLTDVDLTTDATPEEIKTFLMFGKINDSFAHLGSIVFKFDEFRFDITTLRKETNYLDSRHPNDIVFVKTLEEDVIRRDFTANALYLDDELHIVDLVSGVDDIKKHILRSVGNPDFKIKQDPLRIFRALRFSLMNNFKIDEELDKAIRNNIDLINKLNIVKIKQEIHKIHGVDDELLIKKFKEYGIEYLLQK